MQPERLAFVLSCVANFRRWSKRKPRYSREWFPFPKGAFESPPSMWIWLQSASCSRRFRTRGFLDQSLESRGGERCMPHRTHYQRHYQRMAEFFLVHSHSYSSRRFRAGKYYARGRVLVSAAEEVECTK